MSEEKVEKAIKEGENLEHYGTLRLNVLSQKEQKDRLNINQRPKLSYDLFNGEYSEFAMFLKNQEQLFSNYLDQNKKQLVQLSKITSPEI